MYEYRNVKTGEIVVTSNKVSGGSWEPVEQEQEAPEGSGQEQETEQPKATRRKR